MSDLLLFRNNADFTKTLNFKMPASRYGITDGSGLERCFMSKVEFRNVNKSFGDNQVLTNFELSVDDGEFLVLLGPSGCGKTTALRILAGLENVSSGSVHIGDREVTSEEPKDRDIAMVFQSYALYPHMTVRKNVEFPLRNAGVSKDEIKSRVDQALQTVGLSDLGDRKPGQLSGGQRQRVALARAIVRRPKVFLMDEPLSNLDATLRQQTRADIAALQRTLGTTTLYVTHDQVEALTFAEEVVVMTRGKAVQIGSAENLFEKPAHTFVGHFIGSPGMNFLASEVNAQSLVVGECRIGLNEQQAKCLQGLKHIKLGIRPEYVDVQAQASFNTIPAQVERVQDLGTNMLMTLRCEGHVLRARLPLTAQHFTVGSDVHVSLLGKHTCFYHDEELVV